MNVLPIGSIILLEHDDGAGHETTTETALRGKVNRARTPTGRAKTEQSHVETQRARDPQPAKHESHGHCQVVEAETRIRRVGTPLRSYLLSRRPAPYLSLRPNSRIAAASLDDSRPLRANAVWVGSVGQWVQALVPFDVRPSRAILLDDTTG